VCGCVGDCVRSGIWVSEVVEMSGFERLLEPGCTERPACRCGKEMEIARVEQLPDGSDADVRVYRCAACQHEMRLTVWAPLA
jgi:hypothetical protein